MKPLTLIGLVLIVAGIAGLAYGSFSYTKDTHEASIGPLALSVTEKKTVNVPVWLGAGAILVGLVLVVVRGKT
jgi:TRAP-type C4-dicarboxylate transport system permease small subunit